MFVIHLSSTESSFIELKEIYEFMNYNIILDAENYKNFLTLISFAILLKFHKYSVIINYKFHCS